MNGTTPPVPGAGASRHDPPWPERPEGWRHDAPDPPEAFAVPWTVYDAAGLVLWTLLAQILVGVPLQALGFVAESSLEIGVALVAVEAVTLAGVFGWLAARGGLSWRLLGPVRPRWRHVLLGLGVGVAGFFLATVVPEIVRQSVGLPAPPRQQILDHVAAGSQGLWLVVITVVVVAPVLEELVFRGLLFQALRRSLGLWPGLGLSSLTFAFVHLELIDRPIQLAALLVLGVWLAAAFHRTGSLLVPIAAHALFNGVAIAATLSVATG